MKNKIFRELFESKCEKRENTGRHDWKKLGIIKEGQYFELIFRCRHCQKCIAEQLIFL